MNLKSTASAIGLRSYNRDYPGASLYVRFYSLLIDQLARLKVEPTYLGITGESYPEKLTKFGGRAHKKLIDANFENITTLSLKANPAGSDAPAFDSFFESGVGFVKSRSKGKELYCYFVINESFLSFGSEQFERILNELIDLHPWDFGMGFSDTVERRPVFHFAEVRHDKLTAEEEEAGNIWYNTPPEVRVLKLRSIYPYNIVHERQLSQELQAGVSLKAFIEQGPIGTLQWLDHNNLYLWKVSDESQRQTVKGHLKQRGIVVA